MATATGKQIDRPTRDPLALLRIRVSPPGRMLSYHYAATLQEAIGKVEALAAEGWGGPNRSYAIIATSGRVLRVVQGHTPPPAGGTTKGGEP